MKIKKLTIDNVKDYIDYLSTAILAEPDMMTTDFVDEETIIKALSSNSNELCKSLLAYEDNKVVGRLEYHFYTCIQDNYKMCYVNWIYTLPDYRHRGVAQSLFRELEKICLENNINQYFLIQADNEDAARFYGSFKESSSTNCMILRKTVYK